MKILITGGTNGIGKGVTKTLVNTLNQSNEIIILGRNKKLGKKVIDELSIIKSNNKVSFILCDLTKLSNVKKAIKKIQNRHDYLDGIFINAGVGYASSRVETVDGMDVHFQVNYLSQFMLVINLLELLENSEKGGRIIFNISKTKKDKIFWNDLQIKHKWTFEKGIHQAMVAKRMLLIKLHTIYRNQKYSNVSFIGFQTPKIVWTNQLNIIPVSMKIMARIMKYLGAFISIEKCGEMIAPLFDENQKESLKKSGEISSWKDNGYVNIQEEKNISDCVMQDKLWKISVNLCNDKVTFKNATRLIKM